jgi:cell wall-associated protease
MYKFRLPVFCASLCGVILLMSLGTRAQTMPPPPPDPPRNWHTLDLKTDGYFGISLNEAYDFVKSKKSKPVLVAIIDSGVDTLQKDLQGILWVNPKEKPANGKDDDHNGYVDDVHGWNFLGGKNGKADLHETSEEIRYYYKLKDKYANATAATPGNEKEYAYWLKVKGSRDSTLKKSTAELSELQPEMSVLMVTNGYIKKALNLGPNGTFSAKDLDNIHTINDTLTQSKYVWGLVLQQEGSTSTNASALKDMSEYIEKLTNDVSPNLTERKETVGDDPDVNDGKPYGNNILKYNDASHGTGVAGLIGAKRGNGYGIDGVADNVHIMVVKAVNGGDEYDKDIANAIHYAVDNGAKVINMSFGKRLSPHKDWVDEAFKYAASKDVLLVQASGNDNLNVDSVPQYPNDTFLDGSSTDADNVVNVGASGPLEDTTLASNFSNYGAKGVDVFAPGVRVTSIDTDAEFNTADGTSFASPVVTGIAALLLEYYPKLSAAQLKQVIMESATPLKGTMVYKPGSKQLVDFTTLCKSGGIVNAYKALEIASKMKGERK